MIEFYWTLNKPLQLVIVILLMYMLIRITCFNVGNKRTIKSMKTTPIKGTLQEALQEALQAARKALVFDVSLYNGSIDGSPIITTRAEEYKNYFDRGINKPIVIASSMNGAPFDEEDTKGNIDISRAIDGVYHKATHEDLSRDIETVSIGEERVDLIEYVPKDDKYWTNENYIKIINRIG